MTIEAMIKILQGSIAPCVLISGLGMLLLATTNRFSRIIDRIRQLSHDGKEATQAEKLIIKQQIQILYKRGHLLRRALGLLATSIFFVSLIMLMLFSAFVFNVYLLGAIQAAFIISLVSLIAALIFFLIDISLTLKSVDIEAGEYLK